MGDTMEPKQESKSKQGSEQESIGKRLKQLVMPACVTAYVGFISALLFSFINGSGIVADFEVSLWTRVMVISLVIRAY